VFVREAATGARFVFSTAPACLADLRRGDAQLVEGDVEGLRGLVTREAEAVEVALRAFPASEAQRAGAGPHLDSRGLKGSETAPNGTGGIPHGVSTLRALAAAPSSGRGLAERLGLARPAVARALRALERRGLVHRSHRTGRGCRWALAGGAR